MEIPRSDGRQLIKNAGGERISPESSELLVREIERMGKRIAEEVNFEVKDKKKLKISKNDLEKTLIRLALEGSPNLPLKVIPNELLHKHLDLTGQKRKRKKEREKGRE